MNETNLNFLKLFMVAANCDSFMEAANKLKLSQPAISKSISKLEHDLNVKLFYRENRGISLTNSGQILFKYLTDANNILLSCERALVSANNIENSKIVIGIQSHIARNYLIEKIKDFKEKHKNIKIELVDMSTITMIDNLIEKKLDFIIDSLPITNNYKNINVTKIKELDTCFISNSQKEIIINDINELNNMNLIMPSMGSNIRKNINDYFKNLNFEFTPLFEFDTEELIIDSVKSGFGIGYIISPDNENKLKNNNLKKIRINYELPKVEIVLLTVNNGLNIASELFIKEEIKKELI